MKRILLLLLLLIVACTPVIKESSSLNSVLQRFAVLDAQYGTNWQNNTFGADIPLSRLHELENILQNDTYTLNDSKNIMLALLTASRGLMVKSQAEFAQAYAYGPQSIANLPTHGIKLGQTYSVSCANTDVYAQVADLYEHAIFNAKQSAKAFGEAQRFALPSERLAIQVPVFYRTDYTQIEDAIKGNRVAVKNCEAENK